MRRRSSGGLPENAEPEPVLDLAGELGLVVVEPGSLRRGDQLAGDGLARDGVVELDGAYRCPKQAPVPTANAGLLDGATQRVKAPLGDVLGATAHVAPTVRRVRLRHRAWRLCRQLRQIDR